MESQQAKVRKFLSKKISQLNDIIADLDTYVTEIGPDFYRVCIFGSARIKPDTDEYRLVCELAKALSALGVDVVTGGGPGLMEAANRGAKEGALASKGVAGAISSRSIGIAIKLPFEADANSHLDSKYMHRRFSSRLDDFMRITHAVIVTAGGIGTILEMFYAWQLMQVGHIPTRPVILIGTDMWSGLLEWLKKEPLARGLLDQSDLNRLTIVDTVEEAIALVKPGLQEFKDKRAQIPHP